MAIPVILKGGTAERITLALSDDYDYTGCELLVRFCSVERTFCDLVAGGTVTLDFSAEETATFPLGTSKVLLALKKSDGGLTFLPWQKIKVTNAPGAIVDASILIDPESQGTDEVQVYTSRASFPESGLNGKVYIAKDTNTIYRWDGTKYVELAAKPTRVEIEEGWWSEWELSGSRYDPNVTYTITYGSGIWEVNSTVDHWGEHAPADATYINFRDGELIITRHRVAAPVPTKPSDIGAESQSNKVTSISQYSTNSQYPSAKCVYDIVGNIESALAAINGGSAS